MQTWLTIIIVLAIVAVILDGVRRMRISRRSSLRMSRNVSQQAPAAVDDVNDYGSELPSGGARVVNVRKAEDAVERNVEIKQKAEHKRRNQLKSFRIPEQVSLNLDQQVPTLMESVGDNAEQHSQQQEVLQQETQQQEALQQETDDYSDSYNDDSRVEPVFESEFDDDGRVEPVFSESSAGIDTREEYQGEPATSESQIENVETTIKQDLDDWDSAGFSDGSDEYASQARVKPSQPETQELFEQSPPRKVTIKPPTTEVHLEEKIQPVNAATKPVNQPEAKFEPQTASPKQAPPKKAKTEPVEEDDYHEPELVLVINVMAQKGQQFPGAELLDIVLSQGLRFGTMNIFHRHEEDNGDGEILYSMANIVMPGTFELTKMKTFSTPGVSLFMTLPMDSNSIEAFEDMLTTAKIIAARLQGELKDEARSVLTPQAITHYRSKLQEFVRKQLSISKAPA